METSLGYGNDETEDKGTSQWEKQEDKYMLSERESSKEFLQYKSYHLHLKRKREGPPQHKYLPSTYMEQLAFYRTYFYSPTKVQIMALYTIDTNACPEGGYWESNESIIFCYHLNNIAERIKNKTVIFNKMHYTIVEDSENFQFSQVHYYNFRKQQVTVGMHTFYGLIILTLFVICYGKIYGRYIWKVLHIFHISLVVFYVASYLYHLLTNEDVVIPAIDFTLDTSTIYFPKLECNFYSVSMIAPPVVHILKARHSDEVHPNRDSTVIVISNLMFALIKILQSAKVKQYMEAISQLPLYMTGRSHTSTLFVFFPLYFSTFYFGDVYSLLYFLALFVSEMAASVIHLEIVLEIISSFWKNMPRRIVSFFLVVITIVLSVILKTGVMVIMFFNKMMVMLLEVMIIYCVYPVFRLTDDMSFHLGYSVHICRLYCMLCVPLIYMYQVYKSLYTVFVNFMNCFWTTKIIGALLFAFTSAGVPVVVGLFYSYYKYVLKGRRNWRRMFAPTEDWGPRDYVVRQLRKDYDSRTYTNSEVSRSLSRHIFAKTERKAYDLDISYDPNRRSTQIGFDFK